MIRRASLAAALADIEAGTLRSVARIVVSRRWWDGLSLADQTEYQRRCQQHRIEMSADARLSRHFVEVHEGAGGSPLSSERRI